MMGRPKEFDRKDALIKARNLFWKEGYEKASLGDLLETMGIHRKSLYDTYGSKKELFIEALQSYHDEVAEFMANKSNIAKNGIDKIRSVFESSMKLDGGQQRGCMIINTAAESFEDDAEIRDLIKKWDLEMTNSFYSFLMEAKDEKLISDEVDLMDRAKFLNNAFIGFRVQLKMNRTKNELNKLIEQSIRAVF